ncbi:MAG: glycosyltransferase [Bryobacteraceae bacterium]
MHFGIISPPVPGHLNPFTALAHELCRRGHSVTFCHVDDLATRIRKEGFGFCAIGRQDHPLGSLPQSLAQLGKLDGMDALRFTVRAVEKTTEAFCRDAPDALRRAGVEALLVDQTEPAGGTIAEHLGIPFVTICNALALNRESGVPPGFADWPHRDSTWAHIRNRIGYAAADFVLRRVARIVSRYRRRWGLPAHSQADQSFSSLAQISQQPPAFDYPRRELPPCFHYVGPLRYVPPGREVPFPWPQLDGRPLVYASLGTLQNGRVGLFRQIVEACRPLDVQLVISHAGGLTQEAIEEFSRSALVVPYAPQQELLRRASLTVTHAGLNTVLDTLSQGVPAVAIPITYEQPAIASRLIWTGAGIVFPLKKLTAATLRDGIGKVLAEQRYSERARTIAESIRTAGGVVRAAEIIEEVSR